MQPDLIVLAPDVPHVALVAEIRRELPDRRALEAQLRAYMIDNRCSVGLLVTPSKIWIYRDTLHDLSETSIQEAGELDTAEVLGLRQPAASEAELFHAVRDWLERLASAWTAALPTASRSREQVIEYLVPALSEGRVLSGSLA